MNKKISVIIPVYNVQDYLSKCLESVVNQSYANLEIILVDDGSTDSSGVICDEWVEKDSRIRVVHKENGGISEARNVGLRIATGEYIAFVDSDDIIHSKMYELLLQAMDQNGADISICHEVSFYEASFTFDELETYSIERIENREELIVHFTDAWSLPTNAVWNKVYKRELVDSIFFVEGKYCEDAYFVADVFLKVSKAVWIREKLYGYRVRKGSITHNKNAKVYQECCESILYQRNAIKKLKNNFLDKTLNAFALCKLANLELQATWGGNVEVAKQIREYFIELYKNVGIREMGLKDKCNIVLARYFLPIYHCLHRIKDREFYKLIKNS